MSCILPDHFSSAVPWQVTYKTNVAQSSCYYSAIGQEYVTQTMKKEVKKQPTVTSTDFNAFSVLIA